MLNFESKLKISLSVSGPFESLCQRKVKYFVKLCKKGSSEKVGTG